MKKTLLLLFITLTSACAGGNSNTRTLKTNEILTITCGDIKAHYKVDTIVNNSNMDYRYVENRHITFTYSVNELIVKAKFDYGYGEKIHADIVDTYYGNISWSVVCWKN